MTDFKPHAHLCELVMVKGNTWKDYCPVNGNLSKAVVECDTCCHEIIVNFIDKEMTMIENIERI